MKKLLLLLLAIPLVFIFFPGCEDSDDGGTDADMTVIDCSQVDYSCDENTRVYEDFVDENDNNEYDPGEEFTDANHNGIYDWVSDCDLEVLDNIVECHGFDLEPLDLGTQTWINGRLTSLQIGNFFAGGLLTLGDLPPSIGMLDTLSYLHLGWNALTGLPDEIGNLNRLKVLRIHNNEITSLPATIGNLTSLNQLMMNDNLLESLPDAVCDLDLSWDDGCYFQLDNNLLDPAQLPDCMTETSGFQDCEQVYGCTDSLAYNYDPMANYDDENCVYYACTSWMVKLGSNPLETLTLSAEFPAAPLTIENNGENTIFWYVTLSDPQEYLNVSDTPASITPDMNLLGPGEVDNFIISAPVNDIPMGVYDSYFVVSPHFGASVTIPVSIETPNHAPVVQAIDKVTTVEDIDVAIDISVTDIDWDQDLAWIAISSDSSIVIPEFHEMQNDAATLFLDVQDDRYGTVIISVTVIDEYNLTHTQSFEVEVTPTPDLQIIKPLADVTTDEDVDFEVEVGVIDIIGSYVESISLEAVSNRTLILGIDSLITVNDTTFTIYCNAKDNKNGSTSVTVYARNEFNTLIDSSMFDVTITSVMDPPIFDEVFDQIANVNTFLEVEVSAENIEGTTNPIAPYAFLDFSVDSDHPEAYTQDLNTLCYDPNDPISQMIFNSTHICTVEPDEAVLEFTIGDAYTGLVNMTITTEEPSGYSQDTDIQLWIGSIFGTEYDDVSTNMNNNVTMNVDLNPMLDDLNLDWSKYFLHVESQNENLVSAQFTYGSEIPLEESELNLIVTEDAIGSSIITISVIKAANVITDLYAYENVIDSQSFTLDVIRDIIDIEQLQDITTWEDMDIDIPLNIASEGSGFAIQVTSTDESLVIPSASENSGNYTLHLDVQDDVSGTASITVTVSDSNGSDETTFDLQILSAPELELSDLDIVTISEDADTNFTIQASGLDYSSQITWTVTSSDSSIVYGWVDKLGGGEGELYLDLMDNMSGSAQITVNVAFSGLLGRGMHEHTFTVDVLPVNDLPEMELIGDQVTLSDLDFEIELSATDIEEVGVWHPILFNAESSNENLVTAVIDQNCESTPCAEYDSGTLLLDISEGIGSATITVTASDDEGGISEQTFLVSVNDCCSGIEIIDLTEMLIVQEDEATTVTLETFNLVSFIWDLNFTVESGNDDLVLAEVSGSEFNEDLGVVTVDLGFTPVENQNGDTHLILMVMDDTGRILEEKHIDLRIAPVNDIPEIISINGEAVSGQEITVTTTGSVDVEVVAADPDIDTNGQVLEFSSCCSSNEALVIPEISGYDATSATIHLDVQPGMTGTASVTVIVQDGQTGGVTYEVFYVTVTP